MKLYKLLQQLHEEGKYFCFQRSKGYYNFVEYTHKPSKDIHKSCNSLEELESFIEHIILFKSKETKIEEEFDL